jgi:hypothetical protein
MNKLYFSILIVFVLSLLATPVSASLSYSNYTTQSGTIGGLALNYLNTTNSFTMTEYSTVTGVKALMWGYEGSTPVSVQWDILGVFFHMYGTASLSNTPQGISLNGSDLYESSFNLSTPMQLAPGTYWLTMSNSITDHFYGVRHSEPVCLTQ